MSRPAFCATDFLYQSSCVFAQNGTDVSLPLYIEASMELWTRSSVKFFCIDSGTGAR